MKWNERKIFLQELIIIKQWNKRKQLRYYKKEKKVPKTWQIDEEANVTWRNVELHIYSHRFAWSMHVYRARRRPHNSFIKSPLSSHHQTIRKYEKRNSKRNSSDSVTERRKNVFFSLPSVRGYQGGYGFRCLRGLFRLRRCNTRLFSRGISRIHAAFHHIQSDSRTGHYSHDPPSNWARRWYHPRSDGHGSPHAAH